MHQFRAVVLVGCSQSRDFEIVLPIKPFKTMLLSASEPTFPKHVLDSSQPVLVYFWAPWCKLCLKIQPILSQFQDENPETFKIVSINADETLKLANTYRLKMLPTLLLFESGVVTHRIEGFHGREKLCQTLEKISRVPSPTLA